ncbi:MAG TPA: hypothetical protein VHE99_11650 [Gammaproteobacteria bacterium]|nr:hypothetical protein [Gammaproteobacteria bacterium]
MRYSFRLLALSLLFIPFALASANTPTATSYNDQSLPVSVLDSPELMPEVWLGGSNSSVYGFVAHSQYANYLSPEDALALQLDYGSRQFRMGLSWAHELNEQQRLKISVQHLSQDNNFDFVTGTDHQFIGQNSAGIAYEYALQRRFLEAIHVNGYYFSANNGNLDNVTYITPAGKFVDNRTLIGGTGGGLGIGPRWKLWPGSQIEMTLGYDTVNFDTHNQAAKNSSGFGQNLYFTQRIAKNLAVELTVSRRQPYKQYGASVNWAFYQKPGRTLGLQVQASHLDSNVLPAGNENIVGLNLFYQWGGNKDRGNALCFKGDTSCDLLNWSARSAAYMPGVFVQQDESVVLK